MASQAQTKLKHSLAKKKSSLPKLKNILASPFPKYWPKIDEDDVRSLEELIFADKRANDSGKYLRNRGIHLGLKSCLRSIKNTSTEIVLLSTEIKPAFIVSQIINFSLSREKPIYILLAPNVKEITKKLFDIESLALTSSVNKFEALEQWFKLKAQKFPIPEKLKQYFGKNSLSVQIPNKKKNLTKTVETPLCVNFEKLYVLKSKGPFVPENSKHIKPLEIDEQNTLTGDFISFSDSTYSSKQRSTTHIKRNKEDDDDDLCDYKTDKRNLLEVIKRHFDNTKNIDTTKNECQKMDVDKPIDNLLAVSNVDPQPKIDGNTLIGQIITKSKKKNTNNKSKGISNNNVNYIPMKIHKIQGNPNKKKKNKKTKKK